MVPGNGRLVKWARERSIPADPLPLAPLNNGHKTLADIPRFGRDLCRMAAVIRLAVRSHDIDLVYVNGPRVLPAVAGLDRPVLFHAHNHPAGSASRWLNRWARRAARATVVAPSRFIERQFSAPVTVICNGVPDYYTGPRDFGSEKLRVGVLGRIAPEKGHLDFIRAVRAIGKQWAEFAVYGDSLFSNADYAAEVRREAAGLAVTFHGWQSNIAQVFREIDILAVPSFPHEAAARVIIEAFSAGVPVVAYAAGGTPEMIDHGRTGLLTRQPTAESLAESICQLLGDREWMRKLSLAGRAEWQRRFTLEGFQSAICEAISDTFSHQHSSHELRSRSSSRPSRRISSP
jgi:glycosyltransferase involved in cell wall biosynthesis